ncbi:hypothetical protein [Streptomyces sp. NPDC002573]|uniref:hypothetical protein n=1 Tax=Streptomyces sp. NPDC002573 TaxID=3364651 RepID=UPI00369BCC29
MTTVPAEAALPLPEELRPWIDGARLLSFDDEPSGTFTHVPEAATKVVVRVERNGRRDALVVGPRTRASYRTGKRLAACVQLRLAPGTARLLLGVPAVELVGRALPLGDLPAATARHLAGSLWEMEPEQIVAHLADVLPHRLTAGSRTERLLSTRPHTHHALDDAIEQAELLARLMAWPGPA